MLSIAAGINVPICSFFFRLQVVGRINTVFTLVYGMKAKQYFIMNDDEMMLCSKYTLKHATHNNMNNLW